MAQMKQELDSMAIENAHLRHRNKMLEDTHFGLTEENKLLKSF